MRHGRPALVVIGGFAGSGKTTVSRRLSRDLVLPVLTSDSLGKTIGSQAEFHGTGSEAYVIGYAVLWTLAEEFLTAGVSLIVDTNMAWDVSWQCTEGIGERNPRIAFLPIVLRCPREVCLERIRVRYDSEPGMHGDPDRFLSPEADRSWNYLAALDRDDVRYVDANRPPKFVYADVRDYVGRNLKRRGVTCQHWETPAPRKHCFYSS